VHTNSLSYSFDERRRVVKRVRQADMVCIGKFVTSLLLTSRPSASLDSSSSGHVARLHRLGATNIFFWGGAIVTVKCTQLTIAITGIATILRTGYKTILQAERAEFFFGLYPHLWHCESKLVANDKNEVKKFVKYFLFGTRRQFFGQTVSPVPLLATCLSSTY